MLFYREVVILADHVILKQLINDLGPDLLAALLENHFLRLSYVPMSPAITSSSQPGATHFGVKHIGLAEGPATQVFNLTSAKIGKKKKAERVTTRIMRHLKTTQPSPLIEQSFYANLSDHRKMEAAVALILKHLLQLEEDLPPFKFTAHLKGGQPCIDTDLDFGQLNQRFHRLVDPKHSTITTPLLLSHFINSQEDTCFASSFDAEIANDPLHQKLARLELSTAVAARQKSTAQIDLFKAFNFDEGKDVKSAINSGARSIDEFLKVLEASKRFKQWSASLGDDASLMKEYYRAVTKESWIDMLPAKSMRWAVFTAAGAGIDALGAGGAGTAAGLSLSALDQFYLDRILKGWRPNQFIDQVKAFGATKAA